MADFNFDELDRLAADLGEVSANAGNFINSAVQFTATNVKKAAQTSVKRGSKQWRALPATIDYEIKTFQGFGASVIEAEIGYNRDKGAGKLGNIREFGTPRVAPHKDLLTALEANQDDFEKGLTKALEDAEKKAGL